MGDACPVLPNPPDDLPNALGPPKPGRGPPPPYDPPAMVGGMGIAPPAPKSVGAEGKYIILRADASVGDMGIIPRIVEPPKADGRRGAGAYPGIGCLLTPPVEGCDI
ncbi:MAG: hypothetical protein ACLQLG_03105 [Thermoguttaceae bacterium]